MRQGPDHLQSRANRIAIIGIVIGTVIGVAAIVVPIAVSGGQTQEAPAEESAGPSPVVEESADPGEEQLPEPAVDALTAGTCLSAEATSLPCDVLHAHEVFDVAAECSHGGLTTFLGGTAGRDVLRSDLTLTEQPDGACVVQLPADTSLTRSLHGILADGLTEDRSPWLRRCFDARSEQDVDCGSYHSAEYVWEKLRDSLEVVDCSAHASEYVGTSIDTLSYELALEDLSTSDTELCRISVKGSNTLEGSIRNLGFRPIPLGPA